MRLLFYMYDSKYQLLHGRDGQHGELYMQNTESDWSSNRAIISILILAFDFFFL